MSKFNRHRKTGTSSLLGPSAEGLLNSADASKAPRAKDLSKLRRTGTPAPSKTTLSSPPPSPEPSLVSGTPTPAQLRESRRLIAAAGHQAASDAYQASLRQTRPPPRGGGRPTLHSTRGQPLDPRTRSYLSTLSPSERAFELANIKNAQTKHSYHRFPKRYPPHYESASQLQARYGVPPSHTDGKSYAVPPSLKQPTGLPAPPPLVRQVAQPPQRNTYFEVKHPKRLPPFLASKAFAALSRTPLTPKTRLVANASAALLIQNRKGFPPRVTAALRLKASIDVVNINYVAPEPSPHTLYDHIMAVKDTTLVTCIGITGNLEDAIAQFAAKESHPYHRAVILALLGALLKLTPSGSKPDPYLINRWIAQRRPQYRLSPYSTSTPGLQFQSGASPTSLDTGFLQSVGYCNVLDFAAFLSSLHSASSLRDVVSSTWLYYRASFGNNPMLLDYWTGVVSEIGTLGSDLGSIGSTLFGGPEKTEQFIYQAGLETVFSIPELLFNTTADYFEKTTVGLALVPLLTSFSIVGLIGALLPSATAKVWSERVALIASHLRKDVSAETFIMRLLRFLKVLAGRVREFTRTGRYEVLFGNIMSAPEWKHWVLDLLEADELIFQPSNPSNTQLFNRKLKEGAYSPRITTQLSTSDRSTERVNALRELSVLQAAYATCPFVLVSLSALGERLRACVVSDERTKVNGSYRVEPFAVFMAGDPGLGKTSLLRIIHRALAVRLGRSSDESTIHTIDVNQNFPNFNPTQWFCLADDIDKNPSLPAAGSKPNHAELVMQYVNTAPMNMEGAAIENKGRHWANFDFFGYTTNAPTGALKGAIRDNRAFWRRFNYSIELEVNPLYCAPNSKNIDSSRIPAGEECIWSSIKVSKMCLAGYHHDGPSPAPFVPDRSFDNLPAFLIWLGDTVQEYIERSNKNFVARDPAECCPKCTVRIASHRGGIVCQSEVLMGVFMALFLAMFYKHYQDFVGFLRRVALFCCETQSAITLFKNNNMVLHFYLTELAKKVQQTLFRAGLVGLSAGVVVALAGAAARWTTTRFLNQSDTSTTVPVTNLQPAQAAWKRIHVDLAAPYLGLNKPTWTIEDLRTYLRLALVRATVGTSVSYGFHFERNIFVFPKHLFGVPGGRSTHVTAEVIRVEFQHQSYELVLTPENFQPVPDRDLACVYVPELVGVKPAKARLPRSSLAVQGLRADATYSTLDGSFSDLEACPTFEQVGRGNLVWSYDGPTVGGDCGHFIIGVFGNNFSPVAMHTGMTEKSLVRFGEDVCINTIQPIVDRLIAGLPVAPPQNVIFHVGDISVGATTLAPFPAKSSCWAQLSGPTPVSCLPLGTIPGYASGTFKTGYVPMLGSEVWDELELQECGRIGYYTPPSVKGFVNSNGDWIDPFVVNLNSHSNKGGDPRVWSAAVTDYLFEVERLIGRDRARVLTLYEAIIGVIGTDMGAIDLNTSAGPPFNKKKSLFIRIDHVNRTVDLHPFIAEQIERILAVVKAGDAYSPVCQHVPKDEVISVDKQSSMKVRIFNILPCSYNILLKQYFGPMMVFVRHHPLYFETAIGMNVTSYQWGAIYEHLDAYPHWSAADNSYFDTKESTNEALAVIDLFMRLARVLSYTEEQCTVARGLLFGCMYTTRVIKGDAFQVSYMMATGFWLTILVNTFRNCLQRRYCFLRLRPEGLSECFRDGVRQLTLGDDNIATTKWEWYNQPAIARAAEEFGAVITDAHKAIVMPLFEKKADVSFLKRSFVASGAVMLAPIEKKTLVKMLKWRGSTVLSRVDHHAVIFSNVLAESWMHGEEFFNYVAERIDRIVADNKLTSPQYARFTYAEYRDKYERGVLCVWDPLKTEPALRKGEVPEEIE